MLKYIAIFIVAFIFTHVLIVTAEKEQSINDKQNIEWAREYQEFKK